MSTTSITQQVIKYCQMGFFPICKLQNDTYRIFTPFKNLSGHNVFSLPGDNLESAEASLIQDWGDLNNKNPFHPELGLREIIGFYYHPFKPFEVGDRVTLKNYKLNEMTIISHLGQGLYHTNYYGNTAIHHFELEPYLEPTPQEQPLELTLEEIAQKFGVEVSNLKIKK